MSKPFVDHFGSVSFHYADSRPVYPAELYAYLRGLCAEHHVVWDCGAGSGQASRALVDYFDQVIATDASAQQISQAVPHPRIDYRVAPAEESGLTGESVDFVTVAQALHWFDFDRFFNEVKRVLKPNGVLVIWSYGRQIVHDPAVDGIFQRFYSDVVGAYWPPERRHVEEGYRSIPFPFPLLDPPGFEMKAEWDLPQFISYLRSWSATGNYIKANGIDPVIALEGELGGIWGDPASTRLTEWPLTVLVSRKPL